MDRWLTLDPKPRAGSRPRGPHGPAGTSGPLSLDAPGRWGLQAASGHASAPRGSQDAARPCVSDGALCLSLSRRRPGPRRAALQRPLPGGDRAPPTSPCCRCRGRPPCRSVGAVGAGGGGRARPHPRGPLGPLLCRHRETRPQSPAHPTASAPASRHDPHGGRKLGMPARRRSRTHLARTAHAHRRPRPTPLGRPRAHAGLSSREPLGRGPERQLPGDAQLPGELRPRRPRPERSPLRRVIPRGGPRTTRAPRHGVGPAPPRRPRESLLLLPPRPRQPTAVPAPSSSSPPRPGPQLWTLSAHTPSLRRGGLTYRRGRAP